MFVHQGRVEKEMKKILAVLLLVLVIFSVAVSSQSIQDVQVLLYGEVNMQLAYDVTNEIQEANALNLDTPIYMYINSPGGSVLAGGIIVDAITSSRRPVYTVDVALAASMAGYIYSYGQEKFMEPHAILMFHDASLTLTGDMSHIQTQVIINQSLLDTYNAHLGQVTGLPKNVILDHLYNQWWMLPADAMKNHLLTAVVVPVGIIVPKGVKQPES